LRQAGHEAIALREIGLRDADDEAIWNWAAKERAVIVTKDQDFAPLAAARPGPTVIWVRVGNVVNRVLVSRFSAKWSEIHAHVEAGARVIELR
jgi:predicted nuclease of predicted toxin-antitoxin system